jgi:phospholipid-translocating ATPase
LCVSGVREELQDRVRDTIQALKTAGIKIWMLSGDRVENLASVAISSGIKDPNHDFYFITGVLGKVDMMQRLN